MRFKSLLAFRTCALVTSFLYLLLAGGIVSLHSQSNQSAAILEGIDASVHDRESNLLGYTVIEHYAVFRNHDDKHPAAEMMVKTAYQRDVGKNFSVVSVTGPLLLRKMLDEILATEKKMTQPANRSAALIAPANYEMTVKGPAVLDGLQRIAVGIKPRRESPFLFSGTVWVDAENQAIVRLEGVAARSPSIFTGATQVWRQYTIIDGFAMASHARAVSNSSLLGQTIVKIDYSGYQIERRGK